jgi:SAM-dependent methyltransferase
MDKLESLRDIFGAAEVRAEEGRIVVDGRAYPVIDDVIVLLPREQAPASVRAKLSDITGGAGKTPENGIAEDIQFTFGEEWQGFPEILPEHEKEFQQYFDLLDLGSLANSRICDLGCGIGRWSHFLKDRCREIVLLDFSGAIFVARKNLRGARNAIFFLGDLRRMPFREDFADFLFTLGVLHHLPTGALEEVRVLSRYAPTLLVFLYYALDNRPTFWHGLLSAVTGVRLSLSRTESPRLRSMLTWAFAIGVYLPLISLGYAVRPLGLASKVPLYDFYRGKSLRRIRQDVYDRFFTRIEQRFRKEEILALRDTFRVVIVSDDPPYWHFLCRRDPLPMNASVRNEGNPPCAG